MRIERPPSSNCFKKILANPDVCFEHSSTSHLGEGWRHETARAATEQAHCFRNAPKDVPVRVHGCKRDHKELFLLPCLASEQMQMQINVQLQQPMNNKQTTARDNSDTKGVHGKAWQVLSHATVVSDPDLACQAFVLVS